MDWSTSLVARARTEPPEKGGWNLLHAWWLAADVINPAVHFGVSGAGARAWFGWPDIPELEKLVSQWVRATDESKSKLLASDVQRVALTEVAYVPWGEWVQPTAFRKNVRDVLKFGAPIREGRVGDPSKRFPDAELCRELLVRSSFESGY